MGKHILSRTRNKLGLGLWLGDIYFQRYLYQEIWGDIRRYNSKRSLCCEPPSPPDYGGNKKINQYETLNKLGLGLSLGDIDIRRYGEILGDVILIDPYVLSPPDSQPHQYETRNKLGLGLSLGDRDIGRYWYQEISGDIILRDPYVVINLLWSEYY